MKNYEVLIHDNTTMLRKELYIVQKDNGRITHIAEPLAITMKPYKHGTAPAPTLLFDQFSAEDMYQAFQVAFGVKADSESQLASVKEHLNDMRTIAFHKLGIDQSNHKRG